MAASPRSLVERARFIKTCRRCGRTGSHAFRPTTDGAFECTTATACRARVRHGAAPGPGGRGRLPNGRDREPSAGVPGVAYVIGPPSAERDRVVEAFRQVLSSVVVQGKADRRALTALAARNTKLIGIDAACLVPLGFRSELMLRRRQRRLGAVPIVVYGGKAADFPGLATDAGPVTDYAGEVSVR